MPRYRVTHAVEVSAIVTAKNKTEAVALAFDMGEGPGADVESVDLVSVERLTTRSSEPSKEES